MHPTAGHSTMGWQMPPPNACAPVALPHRCPWWTHFPRLRLGQTTLRNMSQSLHLVKRMLFMALGNSFLRTPPHSSVELPVLFSCMHMCITFARPSLVLEPFPYPPPSPNTTHHPSNQPNSTSYIQTSRGNNMKPHTHTTHPTPNNFQRGTWMTHV